MKWMIAVLIVATAVSASAQKSRSSQTAAEKLAEENWAKLGPTVEGDRGFTIFGKGIRINKNGQYELWVRIIPENTTAFARRYGLPREMRHVVQFATIDCARNVLSLEKTSVLGADDKAIPAKTNLLTPSSKQENVKPGSIGESVFRFVCVETTTMPLTNNY